MLHIHCGDCSAATLRQSRVPGEVIVWGDPVIQGPTPAGLPEDEWLGIRSEYLAGTAARLTAEEIARHLAAQDEALERVPEHDEVVLWFDACLFDQSILVHLLDHLSQRDLGQARVSLLCIGEFPGFARFRGLGELNPEQLASLLPARQPVTPEQTALARRAWAAWCAPDPGDLAALVRADTSALPYLGDALLRRLEQFPSMGNGLDRLEQEALEAVAEGCERLPAIFRYVDEREPRPFIGDTMLWGALEELASVGTPLLTIDGPGPLPRFDDPPGGRRGQETCAERDPAGRRGQETCAERDPAGRRGQETCAERDPAGRRGQETCAERDSAGRRGQETCAERATTPLGDWRVRLTDAGHAVLAGREDRIRLNGIDRWLGGVHLTGRGQTWRWHVPEQRLVRA